MKPIITTQTKTALLRYELPGRVYQAVVYPVKAPNGSTIILYAHETGVAVIWRGGRPLKKAAVAQKQAPKPAPKVNGASSDAIMIIDSDDDEPPAPQPPPQAEFEDDEEELDPDEPYPSIIQQLRLSLNTEVLHIAVPQIPPVASIRSVDSVPAIFSNKMVFTVACADYSVRVVTLPLNPPSDAAKATVVNSKSQCGEEVIRIPSHAGHQTIPGGIAMTWTSRSSPMFEGEDTEDEMDVDEEEDSSTTPRRRRAGRRQSRSRSGRRDGAEGFDLLVASHSRELGGLLKIWRFELSEQSVTASNPISAYQTLSLPSPATHIAFSSAQSPKRRHSQLLITDTSGSARIYDPFAVPPKRRRASSKPGCYVAHFRSTWESSSSATPFTSPTLARHKSILSAAWTSDGRSIFALLSDGEWGIWDTDRTGPNPPADPSSFSIRGYLDSADRTRSSNNPSSPKSRNRHSSLAPSTPNTKKVKEVNLFEGAPTGPSIPNHGGVSVASLQSDNGGAPEDAVIVWYGSDVYRIANLSQFWTRTASGNAAGGFLSPGLSRIQGLPLFGEAITSISQFATTTKEARMAIPRDVLVAGEHRLVVLTSVAQAEGRDLNGLFQKERSEMEELRQTDRALLGRGELDLGGVERLLGDMEAGGSGSAAFGSMVLGGQRKVGFTNSTS
ncbi:hypothetical protein P154DRAFT_490917 [Amniculicola lignicola CBS 123094]|uniref:WD40 repeat-like protein n=1 Tax=Amniculicola lignicola CBS 123094 TaxID=1392246 RepID=A0A6A5WPU5_9PLEO|nr:hypothetical protein P154DRAFT_490917 [Amniculicola lignicola CBS 123094]